MMQRNSIWLLMLVLVLSCSSGRVVSYLSEGYNIGRLNTFALRAYKDQDKLTPEQHQMDSMLLEVMMSQMVFRGYEPSVSPDMFVSYEVVLNASSQSRVNDQYSPYSSRNNNYPYNYRVTTTNYLEGVMIVEVKSPNGKLIWQGSKDFKTGKKISTREILIQSMREIIATFPDKH